MIKKKLLEIMKSNSYNLLFLLIATLFMSSCVQKATYNDALDEIDKYKQIEADLNSEIKKKNNLLTQYENALQNSQRQASSNLNNNSEKGKEELEFVKSSLNNIVYQVQNCSNQDDLNKIKNDLESVNWKVSNFIFFNY